MEEESLFDKSLKKITFAFRLTGLNIENDKRNFKQNCVYLFNFLWLNTDIVGALQWVLYGIASGKNFTELTYVAPCLTLSILGDIKAVFMILNEKKVHILMDNIRSLELKAKEFENSEREDMIKPEIKFLNIIISVLNVLNCLMIVVFDASPLILIAVKYFTTGQLELMLPFLDVYPFDSFDLRYWPFAYIHQIWSECIVLLEICATDYFFFTCCTHIKIQFKLLQHQFQEIIPSRSVSAVDSIYQAAIRTKFQELIKWHQEIIRSANMLEGVYSKSTLLNFCTSSLVICLTGFNVTTIDDKAFVMTFIIFLFMSLLQVFFLCFFGDILMSSSIDVSNAVYNSRWYLTDVMMGRNVLLVQTRAQDPCKLTAAGFADVNLRAYMKILSTAWSYFALLQTIYSTRS
ncbi:odorant receptor 4-like [Ostrinia furnacalis]|uniref:odorant receptor 4-like n=1 Tax=Ostrinia furnacalis TaxID=93504 RepID=UPI00103F2008|nr:odorant receptor 4-like [Ostrinia furnacalis]